MKSNQKLQFSIGIIFIVGTFVWAAMAAQVKYSLGLYLLTGTAIGYVLARSQYGFAGVIRKLNRMGNADLSRAILFLFIITLIIMAALQFMPTTIKDGSIAVKDSVYAGKVPAMSSVKPISWLTMLGGLLFGMGMILAGGCASGSLTGMGDFYIGSWFALLFFIFGSVVGVASLDAMFDKYQDFLNYGPKIHLPDYVGGYIQAVVILGLLFILIAILLRKYEQQRMKKGTYTPEIRADEFLPVKTDSNTPIFSYPTLHKIFKESWSLYTGSALLAIFFVVVAITTGKNWGITSTFIYWGGWILEPLGVDIQSISYFSDQSSKLSRFTDSTLFTDAGSLRNIGIFLGALIYTLSSWSGKVKISWKLRNVIAYSIGGFLMGYGARLADGCNIGAFYSAISSFSLSAFVFGAFMYLGGYFALKILDKCQLDC